MNAKATIEQEQWGRAEKKVYKTNETMKEDEKLNTDNVLCCTHSKHTMKPQDKLFYIIFIELYSV